MSASHRAAPRARAGAGEADSHLSGLARGGSLNLVGAVCNQVALFAITAALARELGRQELGRYALCYAMLSMLGLLSLCGFRSALTRFIAMSLADDDAARLRGTVRLGMGLSIVSSVVLGAALAAAAGPLAAVFHDPGLATGIRLTALTLPAATFSDAALAATQGWRTQRPFTLIGRVYEPVARLVLTIVALLLGMGLTGVFWALVVGAWTAAALAARSLWVRLRATSRARPTFATRAIFSFSMVSWASTLASTGLIWADTLLLGRLTTTDDVGVYNVATRLVTLAVFVMAPINAAFAPQIAHLHHRGDTAGLARTYTAATTWIVRLSLPAFVVLAVFPSDLLRLFGKEYAVGAAVTAILAFGQLVNAATGPCGTVLNMSGRVALNMVNNSVVLVANVALNLWLIPRYGIVGAAIAWSVSLGAVNLARVIQVRTIVGITPLDAGVAKAGLAAVAAAVAALVVRVTVHQPDARTVVGLAVVVVVYLGATLALGFSASDRLVIRSVTRARCRVPATASDGAGR